MVRRAAQVVGARRQRAPRPQPLLRLVVVGVHVEVESVDVAVLVVAHDGLVVEVHLAVRPVPREHAVGQPRPLVPCARDRVVDPRRVGGRERQDVELVAFLLVGVGHGVRDRAVALDGKLNRMGRDALAAVAVGLIDDAPPARVGTQPEQRVVQLGDRVDRSAAQLVERALDALEREVSRASVVPDLSRARAEQPRLAVIDVDRDQLVRRTLGAGEVQRVDAGAVQQARHPDLLAVWFVEDEVAVEVADRGCAGEVRVANRRERAGAHVVDVAVRVGSNKYLRAVVCDGHRAGAIDGAKKRRVVGRVDLVQSVAGHNVAVRTRDLRRPQAANRAGANGGQLAQPRRAVEEGGLLAAFRYNFWEQIHAPTISGVNRPRNVTGPKDRRLHLEVARIDVKSLPSCHNAVR